jgi:hypothetical protein
MYLLDCILVWPKNMIFMVYVGMYSENRVFADYNSEKWLGKFYRKLGKNRCF